MASNLYGSRDEWKTFTDWILEDSHDDNNLYKIKLTANIEILKTLLNRHKKGSGCRCFFCNCFILKDPPRYKSKSPRPRSISTRQRVPFYSIPSKFSETFTVETQTSQLPSTPKPTMHTSRKPLNKTPLTNVKTLAYQGSVKKDFVKSNITAVRTTPKQVKAAPKKTTLEEKAAPKKATTTVVKATTTKTTTFEGKVGSKLKRATSSTILNSSNEPEVDPLSAALNQRDLQFKQNRCYLFPPTPPKTAMPNIKMTCKETSTTTTVERNAAPKLKRVASSVLFNSENESEVDPMLAALNKYRVDQVLSPPATPEAANAMPNIKMDNKETPSSEKQNQQETRFDRFGGTPTLTLSPSSSLLEELHSIDDLLVYNLLTLGAKNTEERDPCQQSENKP